MICADTSFLISFYGDDVNSPEARRHQLASKDVLLIHIFNEVELRNVLRALVFRGSISTTQRAEWLAEYEADKQSGILREMSIDANAVLHRAEALSRAWTETGGHRGYDILQVAAAEELGATDFWSFDDRQRRLATAVSMRVGP